MTSPTSFAVVVERGASSGVDGGVGLGSGASVGMEVGVWDGGDGSVGVGEELAVLVDVACWSGLAPGAEELEPEQARAIATTTPITTAK